MRRLAALLLAGLVVLAACSSDSCGRRRHANGSCPAVELQRVVAPSGGEPDGTQTFTDLERTHVDTPVDYPQNPPVGGPHNPVWQTCAFYASPIMKERGVHSMEHGAVWITFSPDLPSAQVDVLKTLQAGGKEVLVSPYEGLPAPIVASAWGKQLQLQAADDPRLAQFVRYFDDGPQTPETNTPCSGGTTETAG